MTQQDTQIRREKTKAELLGSRSASVGESVLGSTFQNIEIVSQDRENFHDISDINDISEGAALPLDPVAARREKRRQQAAARYHAKNAVAAAARVSFDVRSSGAFTERLFGTGNSAFYIRVVDHTHADAEKILAAGLEHWHGVFRMEAQRLKHGGTEMQESQITRVPVEVSRVVKDDKKLAIELRYLPPGQSDWVNVVWWLDELLAGDIKSDVWSELARNGLIVNKLYALKEMIRKAALEGPMFKTIPEVPGTTRCGWHGNEFLAPGFKTPGAPEFIGNQRHIGAWHQAGDRDAYLSRMCGVFASNPNVALICGYFVAGSIISRVDSENFMLGIVGRSSEGKTLAIRTALSMRGRNDEFPTFDATSGALKNLLQTSNDQCLLIDETGQSTTRADDKARFVYDVSQGKTRVRLAREMGGYAAQGDLNKSYYSVIFTGEESILAGAKNVPSGVKVRATELHFSRDAGRPLWHNIRTAADADAWAMFLKEHHGWLMPLVIERIQQLGDAGLRERFATTLQALRAQVKASGGNELAQRKVKLFAAALVGVGVLADVLDFSTDAARQAALQMTEGVAREGEDEGTEETRYSAVLQQCLLNRKDFIHPLSEQDKLPERPMGEIVNRDNADVLLLIADRIDDFCRLYAVDKGRFVNWCRDQKILKQHKKGLTAAGAQRWTDQVKERVGGKAKTLCYVLNLSLLDELDDAKGQGAQPLMDEAELAKLQAFAGDSDGRVPF